MMPKYKIGDTVEIPTSKWVNKGREHIQVKIIKVEEKQNWIIYDAENKEGTIFNFGEGSIIKKIGD